MVGLGGGGSVAVLLLSTIKTALTLLIPNRLSPFWSLYYKSFDTKCPGLKKNEQTK